VVGTTTSNLSMRIGADRKILFDGTYFWAFYCDGSNVVYEKSANGTTWTGAATTVLTEAGSRGFGIWEDGTYVWVAAYTGTDGSVSERRITISNETLGSVRSVSVGTGKEYNPQIVKDSSGYLWLKSEDTNPSFYATRSASPNDDSAWDTTTTLGAESGDYGDAMLIPLTSGKVMAVYFSATNVMSYRVYDSGWSSPQTVVDGDLASRLSGDWGNQHYFSAVADSSGNVHLIYLTSQSPAGHLHYTYWNGSSWSAPTDAYDTGGLKYPTLSIDMRNNELYAFWVQFDYDPYYLIQYKKKTSSGWDSSPTYWQEYLGSPIQLSSSYSDDSKIGIFWQEGTAGPYEVKFDFLNLPKWSYTTGATSLAPPSVIPASGIVLTGGNNTDVCGMSASNGTEAWTPYNTGGTIQSRSPIASVKISSVSTPIAYSCSSDNYLYAINASTGSLIFSKNLGVPLQGSVTGQKNLNIAGVHATNTDKWVIFVGTYDNTTTSANKIYALDAVTGDILWTYTGGGANPNLDIISSTPAIDSSINTAYFTSYSAGGTSQPSLWALNTTNGTLRWSKNLGNISSSPSLPSGNVYVGTNSGYLYKYRSQTSDPGSYIWQYDASSGGNIVGFPWYTSGKVYFATTTTGRVYSVIDNGASVSANTSWGGGAGYVSIASPTAPLVVRDINKAYVGSGNCCLYELNLTDGTISGIRTIGSTVGAPALDTSTGYILAGATNGKIYSFSAPF